MPASDQSPGALSALLFEVSEAAAGAGHTYDASSIPIEFNQCGVGKRGRLVGGNGITGRFTRTSSRMRGGAYYVYGQVVMDVSPYDLANLLPLILGGTFWADGTSISTYEEDGASPGNVDPDAPVVDTPYFGMLIDKVADIHEVINAKVNKAVLRGRAPRMNEQGEPDLMKLYLEIVAQRESLAYTTAWPATAPSFPDTLAFEDYVFCDMDDVAGSGQVTLAGTNREIEDFVLTIHNFQHARFVNSCNATSIRPQDRFVGFACRVPYNATNLDLYDLDPEGQAATLKLANDTVSTIITLPKLHIPPQSPGIPGKRDLGLVLQGEARGLADAEEIKFVNDSTP